MRVLIVGCGYIGTPLGEMLAERGDEVFGLKRNPHDLPECITPAQADVTQLETLQSLPEVDAIVYAASAGRGGEEAYAAIYRDGLRNVLTAYAGRALQRVIFVSSTAVYGQDDGSWVDESSPTEPTRFSGRILLEAEAVAASAECTSIALRLGGIYGPGRTRTVDGVRDGAASVGEGHPQYLNHIHRDDCAGVLLHLLDVGDPAPVYIGVDEAPDDRAEMLDWIADTLGVPRPPRVAEDDRPARRGANKRCSSKVLKDSGYEFRYPTYREGYAALIDQSS